MKKQQNQQNISPANLIRQRGRTWEIGKCYCQKEDLERNGEGAFIITRLHKGGKISLASFLVDRYCLGVKDTFFQVLVDEDYLDEYLSHMESYGPPFVEIPYIEAHNWIYGSVEWALEAGIAPHKDFAITKYMLEDDEDESIPIINYEFGKNGEHFLVAMDEQEANKYLSILKKNLKEGEYDFIIPASDSLFDDEYDDDDDEYDDDEYDDDEEDGTPRTRYSYVHPGYPSKYKKGASSFSAIIDIEKSGSNPSQADFKKVLKKGGVTLRKDLEEFALYATGLTCDGYNDDAPEYIGNLLFYALALLAEAGDENSVKVVLETLRQPWNFYDDNFFSEGRDMYINTLFNLSDGQLDAYTSFAKEKGLDIYCKEIVLATMAMMGAVSEELRDLVIDRFGELLDFYTENMKKGVYDYCDPELARQFVDCIAALNAFSLAPKIKKLYSLPSMKKHKVPMDIVTYIELGDVTLIDIKNNSTLEILGEYIEYFG